LAWDFNLEIAQKMKHNDQSKRQVMQMLSEWQMQYSPGIPLVSPSDIVKAFDPPNRDVILARIEQQERQQDYSTAAQIAQVALQAIDSGQPAAIVAELIYNILNPQEQGMGNVQRQQQGMPGEPPQPMNQ
jgi:hypothetical protein